MNEKEGRRRYSLELTHTGGSDNKGIGDISKPH